MKYLISFSIITTIFLTVVSLDISLYIKQYLKNIEYDEDVLSRKVFIDDNEISISDFFTLSKDVDINTLEINWLQDVHKISHLLNIVISCEFSDIIFFIVKFIEVHLKTCRWYEKMSCIVKLINLILIPTDKYISQMISTLVKLLEYSRAVLSSKQNILKILLSWSLYLDDHFIENIKFLTNFHTDENKYFYNNLNSIEIIIFQIQTHLELFVIENCRSLENYKTFKEFIHVNMINHLEGLEFDNYNNSLTYKLLTNYYIKIQLLTKIESRIQPNKYPFFVTNIICVSGVPKIFTKIMPYINLKLIQIVGFGKKKSLFELCKIYCYTPFPIDYKTNIEVLLKNEKLLIEIITKLIISLTLDSLQHIMNDNYYNDTDTCSCKDLLNTLNKFITEITNDGQSLYLINNMVILQNKLWFICNLRKTFNEINKSKIYEIVDELNKFNINDAMSINIPNGKLREECILKSLLSSLSSNLIYIAVHPSLSNLFWERIGFVSFSQISKYIVDFRRLDTYNKNNQVLCDKTKEISTTLISIKIRLEKCLKLVVNHDASRSVVNILTSKKKKQFRCLSKYIKHWMNIKRIITDVIVNQKYEDSNVSLEKILLIIIYNMDNIDLFDMQPDKIINNKRSLINFQHEVNNLMELYSRVMCPLEDYQSNFTYGIRHDEKSKFSFKNILRVHHSEERDDLLKSPELKLLYSYIIFFTYYSGFMEVLINDNIINNFSLNIKMYWNGDEKTIDEIYYNYKMHTFQIQDGYDYMIFLVKWIIAVVYSKILDVLNSIIICKCKPEDDILILLTDKLLFFRQLDLIKFVARPVEDIIVMFIDVIDSFDNQNVEILKEYQIKLINELKYLGISQNSLSEMLTTNRSHIDSILEVSNVILYLKSIYENYKQLKYSNILDEVGSIFDIINLFMFSKGEVLVKNKNKKSVKINLENNEFFFI